MTRTVRPTISGTAVVCCVHDREKRQVRMEAQVAELGRLIGQAYNPRQHKLHLCACCENLFVDPSDEPRFCSSCRPSRLVHPLGGHLPEPKGVIA